jgi:hypothetical protein
MPESVTYVIGMKRNLYAEKLIPPLGRPHKSRCRMFARGAFYFDVHGVTNWLWVVKVFRDSANRSDARPAYSGKFEQEQLAENATSGVFYRDLFKKLTMSILNNSAIIQLIFTSG